MEQKDRELLLKDLCARLPYGICANLPNHHLVSHKYVIYDINTQNGWTTGLLDCAGRIQIYGAKVEDIKPYLRPLSSMTEEEKEEYHELCDNYYDIYFDSVRSINWLNKKMFDYCTDDEGKTMIERALAIEAPKDMYK